MIRVALAAAALATGAATTARAGCVELPSLLAAGHGAGLAAYRSAPALALMPSGARHDDDVRLGRGGDDGPAIVGLWQFTFTSDGNNTAPLFIPDGALLDSGYAQWHSDGTEIMNSSRDPATSNFCLGVWKSVGASTVRLNHLALSWDNTGKLCQPVAGAPSCFVGPTRIREQVSVGRNGDRYEGSVTIEQFDTAQHLIFHLNGRVSAQRIGPD
jgi:hypothetical protein